MNLGGPVWHVSVAPFRPFHGRVLCGQRARRELDGLGDPALGEWEEWTGFAFHLRRRLSDPELVRVGPVVDVRHTPEAARRAAELGPLLKLVPPDVLADEVGS